MRARPAALYKQLGDLSGLQDTLAHLGRLLAELRKSSLALKALDEAEKIARRLRDPSALQACLGDRADVLTSRRRLDDALRDIEERERICGELLGDPCALALAVLQKAALFGDVMKQTAVGLDLVAQAEALARDANCVEALALRLGRPPCRAGRATALSSRDLPPTPELLVTTVLEVDRRSITRACSAFRWSGRAAAAWGCRCAQVCRRSPRPVARRAARAAAVQ